MLRAARKFPPLTVVANNSTENSKGLAASLLRTTNGPAKRFFQTSQKRDQQSNYSSSSSGSAVGTIVKVVGVTGAILVVPVGYAAYDPKFRASLEGYMPFVKPVFDRILPGPSTPVVEKPKPNINPSLPSYTARAKDSTAEAKKVAEIKKKEDEAKTVVEIKRKDNNAPGENLTVTRKNVPESTSTNAASQSKADAERENTELRKEIAVANAKIGSLESKVSTLEQSARKSVDNAKTSTVADLVAFLDGRTLTDEEEKLVQAVVASTADRMETEFDKYIEELEDEHEWELQLQLKRQIAAHADTVNDAMRRQESELEKHFQARLERRLEEERQRFNLQVAGALGRVKGIDKALGDRSRADRASQKAQYLWHTSHALYDAVKYGASAGKTWEEKMKPLSKYVSLAKVFCDSDPFVLSILRAVPEEALERGVYTEDALRERYCKVRRVARRVAMIHDHENSLFRYFLSYMQSLLVMDSSIDVSGQKEIDLTQLDTFRIVDTARDCVRRGNLETAVRLLGQLQGEPKRVAQDWLKEARIYLETQQVARLLLAHASAVGLSTVPVEVKT